jgi:ferredoxin
LGELIVDMKLKYDSPISENCGSCTRCIDACPTDAIELPYLVNAGKCISYQTIENRGDISKEDPTHILVTFTSSYQGDYFIGAPGSKLLVDNFKLIY